MTTILDSALTDDDRARLQAIHAAVDDPDHLVGLVMEYYRDLDRADRTSRPFLYLHLGILAGALERLTALATKAPRATNAVDPHADSTRTLTTRDNGS